MLSYNGLKLFLFFELFQLTFKEVVIPIFELCMIPRELLEKINEFLKEYGYTKVELIQAGYEELLARHDTDFAKLCSLCRTATMFSRPMITMFSHHL